MAKTQIAPAVLDKEIALDLGDVLPRIPADYLQPGPHDPKLPLRFRIGDLVEDIASGKTTMPLSRLAKACPEVFKADFSRQKDLEIPFPWQKIVGQIPHSDSAARGRSEGKTRASEMRSNVLMTNELFPPPRPTSSSGIATFVPMEPNGNDRGPGVQIQLSLAAILAGLPKDFLKNPPGAVNESLRVGFPLERIEPQLATGKVEVTIPEFVEALPQEMKGLFAPGDHRKVPIPL